MKGFLYGMSDKSDFAILELEVDKIHVLILAESEPKISVLQIVSRLKQVSIIKIWEEAPNYLKKHFWKEKTFWSDGYFACSIGNVSQQKIRMYIQSQ